MVATLSSKLAPALLLAGVLSAQEAIVPAAPPTPPASPIAPVAPVAPIETLYERLQNINRTIARFAPMLPQPGPEPLLMEPWQPDPQAPPAPPVPPSPPVALRMAVSGSYLGIGVQEITANRAKELKLNEERGVEVTNVADGSPAEKAGLQKGDAVLEYQGQRVEGVEQFVRFVRETPAGRNVKLLVSRNGQNQTITATVASARSRARARDLVEMSGEWPPRIDVWIPDTPRPSMAWRSSMLGVEAEGLEGQLAQYFGVKEGVLVRSVIKNSAAEKAGVKAGDVIVKVDQANVDSPRELSEAVRGAKNRKAVPLSLYRDRKEMTLTVTLDEDRSESDRRTPARSVRQRDRF
ncbi:MAG: PDZ domain-containing protein [Bryobacterales bacterium]|nr:PDZ domain-containing protein [Bryobacterales bacterium]